MERSKKEQKVFTLSVNENNFELMSNKAITANEAQLSNFFIPILLSKTALEQTINEKVDGPIFDDKITEGSLQIRVKKVDAIKIDIRDTAILYRVPLHILIKKELLLTSLEAVGDIALDFQTNYTLNSDWTITTATQLTDYKWIKEPKATVLGFKVPVKAVADSILSFTSKKLTDAIDKQVNESLALKQIAAQAWQLLQKPILVFEQYDTKFKFTPTDLAIAPFKTKKDMITSTLLVKGFTQVGIGAQTNFSVDTALLPLKIEKNDTNQPLVINVTSKVPFTELEKIALKNFKGEAYGFGKKKMVIEDIKLAKAADFVTIQVQISGDYTGWLSLKGIPIFNPQKNQLEIKDIEFNLDTKNFLLDTKKWLLNGLLINKLEGGIIYTLTEDLAALKTQVQNQIANFKIQDGIFLKGKIRDIKVKEAQFKDDSLVLGVQFDGAVEIQIDAIPA